MPVPNNLIELLRHHPRMKPNSFIFPSPRGNHEYHMLDRCKEITARAGLDPGQFDLRKFRSSYATRMLRAG